VDEIFKADSAEDSNDNASSSYTKAQWHTPQKLAPQLAECLGLLLTHKKAPVNTFERRRVVHQHLTNKDFQDQKNKKQKQPSKRRSMSA
jgi:hypothetical protein